MLANFSQRSVLGNVCDSSLGMKLHVQKSLTPVGGKCANRGCKVKAADRS